MASPREVIDLIERFERNRDTYRSSEYNEAQVRLEFIDPFFKALGWDMYNEAGYAEAYKDVVHEDAIKIGGATKAPDYAFRIGGVRKFFVEASAPAWISRTIQIPPTNSAATRGQLSSRSPSSPTSRSSRSTTAA